MKRGPSSTGCPKVADGIQAARVQVAELEVPGT